MRLLGLSKLGISPRNFYNAKRKYAPKQDGDNAGEFLQLVPRGSFFPAPIKSTRFRSIKQEKAEKGVIAISIGVREPIGIDAVNWRPDRS